MTTSRYPIPAGEFEHETEVQRSRFRAAVAPTDSIERARSFIEEIRRRDPTATHHCWAYLIGPPGATDRVGMSDDREPHGTAGRPMLRVISHAPVGDITAVVTRWFGGTKLGTGGLARAYANAVQQAIELMPMAERIQWRTVAIEIDYAGVEPLRRLLVQHEAEMVDEDWAERATITVRVPEERCDALAAQVTEMSNGTARLRRVGGGEGTE